MTRDETAGTSLRRTGPLQQQPATGPRTHHHPQIPRQPTPAPTPTNANAYANQRQRQHLRQSQRGITVRYFTALKGDPTVHVGTRRIWKSMLTPENTFDRDEVRETINGSAGAR